MISAKPTPFLAAGVRDFGGQKRVQTVSWNVAQYCSQGCAVGEEARTSYIICFSDMNTNAPTHPEYDLHHSTLYRAVACALTGVNLAVKEDSTGMIHTRSEQHTKHTAPHLSEVPRVELVEEDTVVVLATGVTTPTGMLPVLPDSPVARRDVPPLLAVLGETGRLPSQKGIGKKKKKVEK